MRTTFDLDDDVLAAAKALAKARHTTAGRLISDTLRRAIQMGLTDDPALMQNSGAQTGAYGFRPLTGSGQAIVTSATVRILREETGD
jgi:hypothetical protein